MIYLSVIFCPTIYLPIQSIPIWSSPIESDLSVESCGLRLQNLHESPGTTTSAFTMQRHPARDGTPVDTICHLVVSENRDTRPLSSILVGFSRKKNHPAIGVPPHFRNSPLHLMSHCLIFFPNDKLTFFSWKAQPIAAGPFGGSVWPQVGSGTIATCLDSSRLVILVGSMSESSPNQSR